MPPCLHFGASRCADLALAGAGPGKAPSSRRAADRRPLVGGFPPVFALGRRVSGDGPGRLVQARI